MVATKPKAAPLPYSVRKREVIAETADLAVKVFTLAPGERIPWHSHSAIDDVFFCLAGVIGVETRAPAARHRLRPGETCTVPARVQHLVTNGDKGTSRYLLVQGVGTYDYIPADKPARK